MGTTRARCTIAPRFSLHGCLPHWKLALGTGQKPHGPQSVVHALPAYSSPYASKQSTQYSWRQQSWVLPGLAPNVVFKYLKANWPSASALLDSNRDAFKVPAPLAGRLCGWYSSLVRRSKSDEAQTNIESRWNRHWVSWWSVLRS